MKIYSTKEIIIIISEFLKEKEEFKSYEFFEIFEKEYRFLEEEIKNLFPENVWSNFPIKNDVLKLVIKEMYNIMPFSKPYVLKNYEKKYENIDYLLYPSNVKPNKLMIFFSGFSGKKTYNRFSWYWDEKEKWNQDSVYLFLNDLDETWYVGTPDNPKMNKYSKIIEHVMSLYNLTPKQVYAVGGSMGGYASLLFSFHMGFRACISVHPQITFKATKKYKNDSWENKIRNCGHLFYDLTDFIFKNQNKPMIYLEYGMDMCDIEACEDFVSSLQKREHICFIRKSANPSHNTDNPSFETVNNLIHFFENTGYEDGFIGDKNV